MTILIPNLKFLICQKWWGVQNKRELTMIEIMYWQWQRKCMDNDRDKVLIMIEIMYWQW